LKVVGTEIRSLLARSAVAPWPPCLQQAAAPEIQLFFGGALGAHAYVASPYLRLNFPIKAFQAYPSRFKK
jgi:hypothetical protein